MDQFQRLCQIFYLYSCHTFYQTHLIQVLLNSKTIVCQIWSTLFGPIGIIFRNPPAMNAFSPISSLHCCNDRVLSDNLIFLKSLTISFSKGLQTSSHLYSLLHKRQFIEICTKLCDHMQFMISYI